jgi:hypothetical protein
MKFWESKITLQYILYFNKRDVIRVKNTETFCIVAYCLSWVRRQQLVLRKLKDQVRLGDSIVKIQKIISENQRDFVSEILVPVL